MRSSSSIFTGTESLDSVAMAARLRRQPYESQPNLIPAESVKSAAAAGQRCRIEVALKPASSSG